MKELVGQRPGGKQWKQVSAASRVALVLCEMQTANGYLAEYDVKYHVTVFNLDLHY